MVINEENLDRVFGALADTTRRGILAQLSHGEATISALGEPYQMSQPAISKHLRVLENADLITRSKRGREHIIRANPIPAEKASAWITYYANLWQQQFDAVEDYLHKQQVEIL